MMKKAEIEAPQITETSQMGPDFNPDAIDKIAEFGKKAIELPKKIGAVVVAILGGHQAN
jgi:hypothetical protein